MKKALINLHTAIFLAGFTGVLGRLITLDESLLVWYRLLITVASIAFLFVVNGSFPRISITNLIRVFAVGAVVALHWLCFYGSIKRSNVSIALVCFSTLGFFSSIIEPLLLRRKAQITEVMLGMLAIIGVYLIFHFDTRFKTGIIFGILSAILAALFTVLNKSLLKTIDEKAVTFYELTGGFLCLTVFLPVYLVFFKTNFRLPAPWDWFWLIILSWACTIWAFYLSLTALKKISSFTVNLSYNLEPIYGILLAFIIYRENQTLTASFYAGLFLILAAVGLQMLRLYSIRRGRKLEVV
jgi:drug/metabolite transporter (DMT)-like permease